jgi:site-specific DNA-methyltransferase (adenine-specific)
MTFRIIQGDNRVTLKTLADNSIDAIVTDPPYGIDFLGKSWDANTGAVETYQECLRVLKPGGHILAFSAARTYHHLAITLEQAGFEIRDQIMWIYSSGFPKSQDIGKSIDRTNKKKNTAIDSSNWQGWGTALKPAHEPIALARKPLDKSNSIARNCQQWGVGALNIDATRVAMDPEELAAYMEWMRKYPHSTGSKATFNNILSEAQDKQRLNKGQADILEDREALIQSRANGRFPSNVLGEIPLYQKYFYCPKVSRKERHTGFPKAKGMFEIAREHGYTLEYPEGNYDNPAAGYMVNTQGNKVPDLVLQKLVEQHGGGNNHPTVKPIELMKYLIKLITPPGGIVLDPFNGSGSTGCAAVELGYEYIGCELDPAYVSIAETRIRAWQNKDSATNNY